MQGRKSMHTNSQDKEINSKAHPRTLALTHTHTNFKLTLNTNTEWHKHILEIRRTHRKNTWTVVCYLYCELLCKVLFFSIAGSAYLFVTRMKHFKSTSKLYFPRGLLSCNMLLENINFREITETISRLISTQIHTKVICITFNWKEGTQKQ